MLFGKLVFPSEQQLINKIMAISNHKKENKQKKELKKSSNFTFSKKNKLSIFGNSIAFDWFIVISFSLILLICLTTWSLLFFKDVSDGKYSVATLNEKHEENKKNKRDPIDKSRLDRVMGKFLEKQNNFNSLIEDIEIPENSTTDFDQTD